LAKKDFRHGFKAEAERIALELRAELDLEIDDPMVPAALAEHLCVPIRTLLDLADVARDEVQYFLGRGRSVFSAATVYVGRFKRLIITNPAHATTRQMNSLCHELSHIVLDHEAEAPVNAGGGRAWNGLQEREADWLAGCLLIPNDAAHAAARAGRSDEEVASAFGVSRPLATWRMRMTGARIRAQRLTGIRG
jgi:Zn-dependent peptidase ImmA (M78 family)